MGHNILGVIPLQVERVSTLNELPCHHVICTYYGSTFWDSLTNSESVPKSVLMEEVMVFQTT